MTTPSTYYCHERREIAGVLPSQCGRVLEIGCGNGATLRWLKQRPGTLHTTGVEISEQAAAEAKGHVDVLHCLDFERAPWPARSDTFDTILCLDVLEHLINPWSVLDRLVTNFLAPGGTIIVTVPNVQHHSVVVPLLLNGVWRYRDAGILDRTHLRFFTRQSALELMRHPFLTEPECHALSFEQNSLKRWINRSTLKIFEGLITPQYMLSANRKISQATS